ncbi:putative O-glycosylation ligase, exosortase A system-associated [Thauera sp.]|uniref:putative O-glycosylation ligase, exosortase A system-associated n=1 Tax=Thauera sp. TaxID=1905334 RepID=UPI001B572C94|nr:putative O-glycosylation ligase, exosortase A system-associated [Thauera sp.]MBP6131111.1 putative O-glycosylation ligase, exosortase A system-associated [Thauera sp.]MBP7047847.1 putative O-glycosylation ligase, exosortase A system-associated [Thauera sp.]
MRDLIVTLAVFGTLPFILRYPWIGILAWSWLSYMNPHRMAWGFSTSMPFAFMVALATFVGILFSREKKEIVWSRETWLMLVFTGWMFLTTAFSWYPGLAWPQWDKVWRIMLMTYVTLMLIRDRDRVHWLVVVIAFSLAFYGVKGGIFVLTGGSGNNVRGPGGSFIEDRNSIGLALLMTVPLLWYIRLQLKVAWQRLGLLAMSVLTLIAVIGTHSRGALVGLGAMGVFFLLKARNRLGVLIGIIPVVLVVFYVMPPEWFERMHTIQTYDEDGSAQGRIYAWGNAVYIANSSLLGGGFRAVTGFGGIDSHSNWFGTLGEQGWPGLVMFVLLHIFTWRSATQIIRMVKPHKELTWARDLAAMIQVSLIGYMSAGSFLGLQYFDLFYHLIVIIVVVHELVRRAVGEIAEPRVQARGSSASGLERPLSSAGPTPPDKSHLPQPRVAGGRFASSRSHR